MRRILICTGVLGGGTALTFAVAALAATILPGGRVVAGNPVFMERDWAQPGFAVPMPRPADGTVIVEDADGQTWEMDGTALPGGGRTPVQR
jgi:hypothetical protein